MKKILLGAVVLVVVCVALYFVGIFLPHRDECSSITRCAYNMMSIGFFLEHTDPEEMDEVLQSADIHKFRDALVLLHEPNGPLSVQCAESRREYGFCPLSEAAAPDKWILLWDDTEAHISSWRHKLVPQLGKASYSGESGSTSHLGGMTVLRSWTGAEYTKSLLGKRYEGVNVLYADGTWRVLSRADLREQLALQGFTERGGRSQQAINIPAKTSIPVAKEAEGLPLGGVAEHGREPGKGNPCDRFISEQLEELRAGGAVDRYHAARKIGCRARYAERAVPDLAKLLPDRYPVVWRDGLSLEVSPTSSPAAAAAEALGKIGPAARSSLPDLVDLLGSGAEYERRAAALAVGQICETTDAQGMKALRQLLTDKSKLVQCAVRSSLVLLGDDPSKHLAFLREALKDQSGMFPTQSISGESTNVSIAACEALGFLGPAAAPAVPEITALLSHKDYGIRHAAASTLGKIGASSRSAVSTLMEMLGEHENSIGRHAAYALGDIGGPAKSAIPALHRLLDEEDCWTRQAARYALVKLGSDPDSHISALVKSLQGNSWAEIGGAASTLGKLNATQALPALYVARRRAIERNSDYELDCIDGAIHKLREVSHNPVQGDLF